MVRGEGAGRKAHLEVGTVPQQVPRAPILSVVTLNSRDLGPVSLYGILSGSAQGQGGPRAPGSYIIQPGSGLD